MYKLKCFVLQNSMKAIIALEKPIYNLTNGKLCKNRFLSSVNVDYIGTNVKIVKETNNATYIAKYNEDGTYRRDYENAVVVLNNTYHDIEPHFDQTMRDGTTSWVGKDFFLPSKDGRIYVRVGL